MDDVAKLLLNRIPTTPDTITTTELRRALASAGHALTARAVQKRLVSLAELKDITCDPSGKPYRWSWKRGQKQRQLEQMSPPQALALALAAEHIRPLLPPVTLRWLDDRIDAARRQLETESTGKSKGWHAKVRRVPHEVPRTPPPVDPKVFANVSEALYEGVALSLEYRKRFADEPGDYVVHPLGLLERGGELWLVARKVVDDELGEVHQFVLHRMRSAQVLRGVVIKPPPGFSLDGEVKKGRTHFLLELGSDMRLVARFRTDVVAKLVESPLGADQKVTPIDADWSRVTVTIAHTRALEAFLLGYGPLAVVEKPARLRDAVAVAHREAAAAYAR